jgi:hypothetical protein
MNIYARQGDLVIETTTLTGDLTKGRDIVFAGDSSGHRHTLSGAVQYRREGLRTFIRLVEPARLEHGKPDGHPTVTLAPGDYEVRPLRERGKNEDRAVED